MPNHQMIDNVKVPFTEQDQANYDARQKRYLDRKVERDALAEIRRLEVTITARRLRDALANDEGKKWVNDVEKLIAVDRGKLPVPSSEALEKLLAEEKE